MQIQINGGKTLRYFNFKPDTEIFRLPLVCAYYIGLDSTYITFNGIDYIVILSELYELTNAYVKAGCKFQSPVMKIIISEFSIGPAATLGGKAVGEACSKTLIHLQVGTTYIVSCVVSLTLCVCFIRKSSWSRIPIKTAVLHFAKKAGGELPTTSTNGPNHKMIKITLVTGTVPLGRKCYHFIICYPD